MDLNLELAAPLSSIIFANGTSNPIEVRFTARINTLEFCISSPWIHDIANLSRYFVFLRIRSHEFLLALARLGVLIKNEPNSDVERVKGITFKYKLPKGLICHSSFNVESKHPQELFMRSEVISNTEGHLRSALNSFSSRLSIKSVLRTMEYLGVLHPTSGVSFADISEQAFIVKEVKSDG